MRLAALLSHHDECLGPKRLSKNLGDGFLYKHNRVYKRVRDAAIRHNFSFTTGDTGHYFGFPLLSLPALLRTGKIPYRDNVSALRSVQRRHPGALTLADLKLNRPTPNYVLHEGAHAVAFATLWGRPTDPETILSDEAKLPGVMLCEAFAMTAEYLAACHVTDGLHRWFFSINTYRHSVPGKQAIGQIIENWGRPAAAGLLLGSFLYGNYLRPSLDDAALTRIADLSMPSGKNPPKGARRKTLRANLSRIMRMNPDFLNDTARLFLKSVGHRQRYERLLAPDPLAQISPELRQGFKAMMRVLS